MALTPLQRRICTLLAGERKRSGESYVAGGVALNEVLGGARRSRDVDLFHDTAEALAATWPRDRDTLTTAGLRVHELRVLPSFVEADVSDGVDGELVQWAQDSAYRFYPLVEDDTFGLTLHPLDLATNKVLALVGRRTVRDWVDAIRCHDVVQPLGYLAWAAAGKDPGFSPLAIVEEAARTRYAQAEIDRLDFEGPRPRAADLSARWHAAVAEAREIVRALPADEVGPVRARRARRVAEGAPRDHRGGALRRARRLPRRPDPRRVSRAARATASSPIGGAPGRISGGSGSRRVIISAISR